jgi:hypothetical protein
VENLKKQLQELSKAGGRSGENGDGSQVVLARE